MFRFFLARRGKCTENDLQVNADEKEGGGLRQVWRRLSIFAIDSPRKVLRTSWRLIHVTLSICGTLSADASPLPSDRLVRLSSFPTASLRPPTPTPWQGLCTASAVYSSSPWL